MAILINLTGFFLSLLPYKTLEFLTECLGKLFISFPSARRRILFSNLHHALPHRSYDEIKRIARESAARMFEMGFFSLCYPFLGHDELRRSVVYSSEAEEKIRKLRVDKLAVNGKVKHLKADLLHFSYPTLNSFLEKTIYFSDIFAQRSLKKKRSIYTFNIVLRSIWRFFRAYILRLGFLDGFPGLFIAVANAYTTFFRHSKLYELKIDKKFKS